MSEKTPMPLRLMTEARWSVGDERVSVKGDLFYLASEYDALRTSHTTLTEQNQRLREAAAALTAALDALRKNIDSGLLVALRNGGQLDMDGCEVRVSRQACEEAADHLEQIAALATPKVTP